MKVYEIMYELSKMPANKEVLIRLQSTSAVAIEDIENVDNYVTILLGGDAELYNENSEPIGSISSIIEYIEEEERNEEEDD